MSAPGHKQALSLAGSMSAPGGKADIVTDVYPSFFMARPAIRYMMT